MSSSCSIVGDVSGFVSGFVSGLGIWSVEGAFIRRKACTHAAILFDVMLLKSSYLFVRKNKFDDMIIHALSGRCYDCGDTSTHYHTQQTLSQCISTLTLTHFLLSLDSSFRFLSLLILETSDERVR